VKTSEVACIILASGLSRRFGQTDKLSAELCGRPLLSYVFETVRAVDFGEVFVVSDWERSEKFSFVENKKPELGQGHTMRLGLRSAQKAGWKACMILLGDMPLVPSSYLSNMIEKNYKKQSIVSVSESIRMPPALFVGDTINQILTQTTTEGARVLFDLLNIETAVLKPEFARDVDTLQDLASVTDLMKARKRLACLRP